MSNSSPDSIKSQTLDHGFRSQVPFYTQAPDQQTSIAEEDLSDNSSISPGISATASEIPLDPSAREPKEQLSTDVTRLEKDKDKGKHFPPNNFKENERIISSTRSTDSIECAPLDANFENTHTMPSPSRDQDKSGMDDQPFPLVQWIKRIRDETPRQWPTGPLKWSRSIPKRQRTILDADEAWCPPLPGKPIRQGTVPIDILTELIQQTDKEALTDAVEERTSVTSIPSQSPEPLRPERVVEVAQHDPERPTPATSSHDGDDSEQEPWSPTPPSRGRRALPVDTSPVRPLSRAQTRDTPADSNKPESFRELYDNQNHDKDTTKPSDKQHYENRPLHPSVQSDQLEDSDKEEQSNNVDLPKRSQHQANNRVEPVHQISTRLIPVTQKIMSPRLVNQSRSTILVKDTPHPLKDMPHSRRQSEIMEDTPQSSLVAGTYPELTRRIHRSERDVGIQLPSSPPDNPVEVTPSQFTDDSHTTESRPPIPSLQANTMQEVEKDNTEDSVPLRSLSSSDVRRDDPSSAMRARKRLHGPRKILSVGRSSIGSKQPSTSPNSLAGRTYAFNERRKAASRIFRKSIATRVHNDEGAQLPMSNSMHEKNNAGKRMSSSPISVEHIALSARSNVEDTSITDHSIHSLAASKHPTGSRTGSRNTPHEIQRESQALLQSFQNVYPHYRGSSNAFRSALQLLAGLRMAPREPHPSLWDDFVYRMAYEYKIYLQKCIDQDESAMPYADYYFLHVQKPKCHQAVINRETLKTALGASTRGQSSTLSSLRTSVSNANEEPDVPEIDVQTHAVQHVLPRVIQTSAQTIQETQESPGLPRPMTSTKLSEPRHQNRISGLGIYGSAGSETLSRKRRSLPWTSDGIELGISSSTAHQPANVIMSNKKPSVKTTVERWLDRPAGASSPELVPTAVPVQVETNGVRISSNSESTASSINKQEESVHRHNLNISKLQLPGYLVDSSNHQGLTSEDAAQMDQESVVSSIVPIQNERPVTPFTLFARNFANLQAEKGYHESSSLRTKLPINVYNW